MSTWGAWAEVASPPPKLCWGWSGLRGGAGGKQPDPGPRVAGPSHGQAEPTRAPQRLEGHYHVPSFNYVWARGVAASAREGLCSQGSTATPRGRERWATGSNPRGALPSLCAAKGCSWAPQGHLRHEPHGCGGVPPGWAVAWGGLRGHCAPLGDDLSIQALFANRGPTLSCRKPRVSVEPCGSLFRALRVPGASMHGHLSCRGLDKLASPFMLTQGHPASDCWGSGSGPRLCGP